MTDPKVADQRDHHRPDWERIGIQYRMGTMSLREIALTHGLTEGAIRKRAKRDFWVRDLTDKVRIKADALVRRELVRTQVRNETLKESAEIETEAKVLARVRLSHRKDIAAARGLVRGLLEELGQLSSGAGLAKDVEAVLDARLATKSDGKLPASLRRALSLGSRATIAKSLMDALRTSVQLEREAFGLDVPGKDAEEDPLTSLLRNLKVRSLPVVHDDPSYLKHRLVQTGEAQPAQIVQEVRSSAEPPKRP